MAAGFTIDRVPVSASCVTKQNKLAELLDRDQIPLSKYKKLFEQYRIAGAHIETLFCLYGISKSEVFGDQYIETFKSIAQTRSKNIRECWNKLKTLIEQMDISDDSHASLLYSNFKESLFKDIGFLVSLVIEICDEQHTKPEVQEKTQSMLFFHKMKADYARYQSEVNNSPENVELGRQKDTETWNYVTSLNLPVTNPNFLGFVLNRSVCMREVNDDPQGAIEFTQKYLAECEQAAQNEDLGHEADKMKNITGLMKENLAIWNNEIMELKELEKMNENE